MRFCSQCGSQLEPNSAFCSRCGSRVKPPAQMPQMGVVNPSKLVFTLPAIETKGASYNYIYMLFYTDKVVIAVVSGKAMEKDIYETLKVLKKQQKMKLRDQMAYRQTHLDHYSKKLETLTDQQILSMGPSNAILPIHLIHQGKFQFVTTKTYDDGEDLSTSKTRGYIELVVGERVYKYYHTYSYMPQTKALVESVLPGRMKYYQ